MWILEIEIGGHKSRRMKNISVLFHLSQQFQEQVELSVKDTEYSLPFLANLFFLTDLWQIVIEN